MASIPQDETPERFVIALIDGRPNPIQFYEICLATLGASGFDVFEVDTRRYALTSNEGGYPRIVDKSLVSVANPYERMIPRHLCIFMISRSNHQHIADAFPIYFALESNRSEKDGEMSHAIKVLGRRVDLEEIARILTI